MSLNPEQKDAATHVEGPLLVLAGAGSGKTRIVTHRIAYLLSQGVRPDQIVAVTFTNKAAEEMRTRVNALSHAHVLTCTFHSLATRILRESIGALGYRPDFTIYDEKDSESLLKTCLKALGYEEKKKLKEARGLISQAKNDLLEPYETEVADIYSLYQEKLREYNAVDFDDLLFLSVKLFKEQPEILAKFQDRWKFVLIDEYQDTNYVQYLMAKLLVAKHQNLFVVGDPDQSIYSWRGANIRNILDFERDYPGARVIKLEQNYRSTSNILEAANAVIENNDQRYEKELWSDLGDGNLIGVYYARSENEEAEFVLEKIQEHGYDLNDIVIFYRTNAQSRVYEDLLLRWNLPYVIVGGLSFYQRREIKDLLCYLRMVVSPYDFLSFARTINAPKRGIGNVALERLRHAAETEKRPILEVCEHPGEIKLTKKQRIGLAEYAQMIGCIREMSKDNVAVSDLIIEMIERSNYLDHLKADPESFDERKQNLDELIAKATESDDLVAFLEELSLKSSLDEVDAAQKVRLMTIHNGKGLEFPLVFMVGMEEELFPHINSLKDVEEERRLCYVGMTRAKEQLYMSSASYRLIWGQPRNMRPSRFLSEIPEHYVDAINQPKSLSSWY